MPTLYSSMTPNRKTLVLLALGVLLGIAIWLFSPWLTGKVEPWDADAPIKSAQRLIWNVPADLDRFRSVRVEWAATVVSGRSDR